MKIMFSCVTLALIVAADAAVVAASPSLAVGYEAVDLREHASVTYAFDAAASERNASKSSDAQRQSEANAVSFGSLDRAQPFGSEGSMRLNIHGGFASDVKTSDNQFGLFGAGISYFIIENLSLDVELNGLYIDQRDANAWAVNMNLLFRWHFFAQETWSIYVDGGAGLFGETKRVPSHGTHFNFTPQAGVGASFEISPDIRMLVGIRWHHISNARTSRNNPGRDSVMGYVGVSLPF